jgi:hypothetical protein
VAGARASRRRLGLAAVAVLLGAAAPRAAWAGGAGCGLLHAGAESAPASYCLACHGKGVGPGVRGGHRVGLDYAGARLAGRTDLRPIAEVVRRGVRLPEGRIECVTCHAAASPWASHIALPPGSVPTPAPDRRAPDSYLRGRSWRAADAGVPPPPPGSAVTPAPLCAACHALAD